MPVPCRLFILATALAASLGAAAAEPPRIRRPMPAPETPPDVAPLPPAEFDPALAIGGDDVEARKLETRLTVKVRVNGRGPYDFVVDSGADTSVVGLKVARDLELPLGTPAVLNSMTARNVVDRVKVARLDVGPTSIHNLELPALSENDVGAAGMIGIDALVQQRLMMDFEERVIKVEDASIPVRYLPGEVIITARRHRGQLILTHVKAAGLELDAVIDTGTQITIGNLALRDKLIKGNRDKFTTVPVIGVTGVETELQMARVGELRLGPVTLYDVPMAFADVPPFKTFGLHQEPALLLGTDILENFRRVSLDFRTRKVRFQLRRCNAVVRLHTSDRGATAMSATSRDVCRR